MGNNQVSSHYQLQQYPKMTTLNLSIPENLCGAIINSPDLDKFKYKIEQHHKYYPDAIINFNSSNNYNGLRPIETASLPDDFHKGIAFYIMTQDILFTQHDYTNILKQIKRVDTYNYLRQLVSEKYPQIIIDPMMDFTIMVINRGVDDIASIGIDPELLAKSIKFESGKEPGSIIINQKIKKEDKNEDKDKKDENKKDILWLPSTTDRWYGVLKLYEIIRKYPRTADEYKSILYNANDKCLETLVVRDIIKFINEKDATHIFAAYRALNIAARK